MAMMHEIQSKNKLPSDGRSKESLSGSKNLTRRDFIKRSAGAVGLMAAFSSPLLPVIKQARASSDGAEDTPDRKKRAWCFIIDLIDAYRCIGCRMCMAACPYQRRFFNWGEPELPPEAYFTKYTPAYPVPAIKGTVIKCAFCPHLLRDGKLPSCITACPMKAIYMGDLNEDIATNGNEVVLLSKFLDENSAYRYKEELGTQPRTWYLPGHGQDFGRMPNDPREVKTNEWPWGGDGWNRRPGVWP